MDRHHILREIKRTAEANGGVPLGVKRFYQETGIKASDWGKFWARWGDALREGGLQPNKLQAAYDESWLFEKYIAFTRELGHLPTWNELRLAAYQSPGFPSRNTFSRWGTKRQRASRLRDYCQARAGYDDILALCKLILNAAEPETNEQAATKEDVLGAVYLVKSGRYHKIGSTNAVGRREYELALQLPEKASLVHEIRTDDPVGIEAYWHRRFATKRKRGEWFELRVDDVKAFRRRKFM